MKELNLPIVIEKDKDGYFAYCPSLEGCISQGETYEQALSNIKEAIDLYIDDMIENDEELPQIENINFTSFHKVINQGTQNNQELQPNN